MKKQLNKIAKIHNRFDVFRTDVRTGETEQIAYAENIILDQLWDALMGSVRWGNNLHIGTGTGELSASRTSLFTYLANGAVRFVNEWAVNSDEGYISRKSHTTRTEVQDVGQTYTEIGFASGTAASTLTTHALLKDMNGNPVSILKTDTDIITFYATVYLIFPFEGFDSGQLRILTDKKTTLINAYFTWLLGQSDFPSSHLSFAATRSNTHHNPANFDHGLVTYPSFTRTRSAVNKTLTISHRIPVADGIFANLGIGSATVSSSDIPFLLVDFLDSTGFSGSPIAGEQIGVGDGVTTDFKTAFPLVRAGATVKVDSVAVTAGVTVDAGKPTSQNITPFVKFVETSDLTNLSIGRDDTNTSSNEEYLIFENPFYATYGVTSLWVGRRTDIHASNDLETWTLVAENTTFVAEAINIASEHQNYRYWKKSGPNSETTWHWKMLKEIMSTDIVDVNNVHFDTAPAEGEVVTIDYETPVVAKDSDHVFDFEVVLSFAEYTEG